MPLLIVLFAVSLLFVVIGITGFTKRGMPLSKTTYLTGTTGKIVGTLCIVGGVLLIPAFLVCFAIFMALLDPRTH